MVGKIAAEGHDPVTVDARGMRCPWPVLRLASAVRSGGSSFVLLADDPATAGELQLLAAEHGWTVEAQGARFIVTPSAPRVSA